VLSVKKAEMDEHRAAYQALMAEARAAEGGGLYAKAVHAALAAWEHIDGMMQYERRYTEKEFASIAAIELVLKYAPFLLDFPSLDALEKLLDENRRIERNTTSGVGEKLRKARERLREFHRLWEHIEKNPDAKQDELSAILGGDQGQWRAVAEGWERMGLVRRTPDQGTYKLAISTRLGEVVRGKCSSCGELGEGPKAIFLEKTECPKCRTRVFFVILAGETPSQREG
jgi:hypothetical protein